MAENLGAKQHVHELKTALLRMQEVRGYVDNFTLIGGSRG